MNFLKTMTKCVRVWMMKNRIVANKKVYVIVNKQVNEKM